MKRLLLLWSVVLAAGAAAFAQPGYPAGYRDEAFANVSGDGSARLLARVWYPATSAGANAPLVRREGGWPWVVFLHGVGALAQHYPDLGRHFASRGYVFVAQDTAQNDVVRQWQDARAMWPTLRAENALSSSYWYQALDPERGGLSGHSMGGGNTMLVLASNPGYRCAFTFAPVAYGPWAVGQLIIVPWASVHGQGDTLLPWQAHALEWFRHTRRYSGLKALVVLDDHCNHYNVSVLMPNPTPADREVFARACSLATGFFDRFLRGESAGLEQVLGRTVQIDPHLSTLMAEIETPELWRTGSGELGGVSVFSLAAEPGPAALLLAATRAAQPLATPYGWLLLDPVTVMQVAAVDPGSRRRADVPLQIPNLPALRNVPVPFQAIGLQREGAIRMGGALDLVIR